MGSPFLMLFDYFANFYWKFARWPPDAILEIYTWAIWSKWVICVSLFPLFYQKHSFIFRITHSTLLITICIAWIYSKWPPGGIPNISFRNFYQNIRCNEPFLSVLVIWNTVLIFLIRVHHLLLKKVRIATRHHLEKPYISITIIMLFSQYLHVPNQFSMVKHRHFCVLWSWTYWQN